MNIGVVGRIRKSVRNEAPTKLDVSSNYRITNRPGGQSFDFNHIYRQDASNADVFSRQVEPLLNAFIAGYNVCFMCFGESDSGKSYTMVGDSSHRSGVIPLSIANLFNKIEHGGQYLHTQKIESKNMLGMKMRMYEIYNERVRDLLIVPVSNKEVHGIKDNAEDGTVVKDITSVHVIKASSATTTFREGWNRVSGMMTDYGPANHQAAVVVEFELLLTPHDDLLTNRSLLTFVDLPGAEKLIFDSANIRLREGPSLNNGILAFSQVVADLANHPDPDRIINYNKSVLTQLLKEQLGGNCRTQALVCMKPHPEADVLGAVLRTASQLAKVKNFPVLNDAFARGLVTQYRAQLLRLQREMGAEPGGSQDKELREELRRVQTENLELRDKNERLLYRMEQLQGKYGMLAHSKTDISSQLLSTEEDRLKVSKALVEMEIENNRLTEEVETVKFDLKNKILKLENDLLEVQMDRDRYFKQAKRADAVEQERKDLADEYVTLKRNYIELNREVELLAAKNEELSIELLNMVNTKATLVRQMENMELASMGLKTDTKAEVERVQTMIGRRSRRSSSQSLKPLKEERNAGKKYSDNFDKELEYMRNQYDDDQQKLRRKITSLVTDLEESRKLAKDRLRKLSETNAQLIMARNEKENLESQHNRMQHKLKDMYEEYRNRLVKYVEDVSDFMDSNRSKNLEQMRDYVAQMLMDIKNAHKAREDQLSQAAQGFKKRMSGVARQHETLLMIYTALRQQVLEANLPGIEAGPEAAQLGLSDHELASSAQKEVARLQAELERAHGDLRMRPAGEGRDRGQPEVREKPLQELRRQVREFTMNTQRDLEAERAELMAKNHMLEEQLQESQDYIEKHLASYKGEIVRLRKKLTDAGIATSPAPPNLRK